MEEKEKRQERREREGREEKERERERGMIPKLQHFSLFQSDFEQPPLSSIFLHFPLPHLTLALFSSFPPPPTHTTLPFYLHVRRF
jgi:hypothetical protein